MTTVSQKSGFFVSVTCPGCGAGLTIDTDFFVLTCDYCDSVIRIKMPDLPPAWLIQAKTKKREIRFSIDRHLKELDRPLTDSSLQYKRIYYPYWKVDAFLMKVRNRIEERLVQVASEDSPEVVSQSDKTDIGISPYSVTIASGPRLPGVPESLGVRSQTIEALPFTVENQQNEFDALEIDRPWSEIKTRIVYAVLSLGDFDSPAFGRNRTDMLYPDYSVIYFPYYLVDTFSGSDYLRFVVDGLSSRVLHCYDPMNQDPPEEGTHAARYLSRAAANLDVSFEKGRGAAAVRTISTGKANDIGIEGLNDAEEETALEFGDLCIELHRCTTCGVDLPETKSPIYICSNCHELKAIEEIKFPLEPILTCRGEITKSSQFLPFWRFQLPPEQAKRLRFIFGGMYMAESMVVPAFKGPNYDALVRLARKMSFAQTRLEFEPLEGNPKGYGQIEVSPAEGVRYMNLLAFREQLVKSGGSKVVNEEFTPVSAGIIYAPFSLENYFYVDSVLKSITFEKQLID
ncbi:MAG: hypothetical protein P1R58_04800 [bacterium]|nr:hypothetical protein [bacterium]